MLDMPPNISDHAVKKATGKGWAAWFALLDKAGARRWKHIEIARWLRNRYFRGGGINVASKSGWWSQMVTVEYERARGLRVKNQYAQGYLVSVHKTLPGSVASARRAWSSVLKSRPVAALKLDRIPSATKRAMIRYRAKRGIVVVMFDPRGKGRSRLMVEAARLPSRALVEPSRKFWKAALSRVDQA